MLFQKYPHHLPLTAKINGISCAGGILRARVGGLVALWVFTLYFESLLADPPNKNRPGNSPSGRNLFLRFLWRWANFAFDAVRFIRVLLLGWLKDIYSAGWVYGYIPYFADRRRGLPRCVLLKDEFPRRHLSNYSQQPLADETIANICNN